MHGDLGGETAGPGHLRRSGIGDVADVDPHAFVARQSAHSVVLRLQRAVLQMVPVVLLRIAQYHGIVLGVHRQHLAGPGDVPHEIGDLIVVVHQYVPRGGTHEQLEPSGRRGHLLYLGIRGQRGEQPVIHVRLPADQRLLLHQRPVVRRRGLGIGHVDYPRDPSEQRGHGAGGEILLLGEPGFAEMHVRIDESRQDQPAPEVDPLVASPDQPSDGNYLPVLYADGGLLDLTVDEELALDDQVHSAPSLPPR